jgi:hypothetical protein
MAPILAAQSLKNRNYGSMAKNRKQVWESAHIKLSRKTNSRSRENFYYPSLIDIIEGQ